MAKKNFYAVKVGLKPGIYKTWDQCKANTHGYKGAIFKGFETEEEAVAFMESGSYDYKKINTQNHQNGDNIKATIKKVGIQDDISNSCQIQNKSLSILENLPENYAFTDGSYNQATKVYGYGGFVVLGDREIPIQGADNDPEKASGRNTAGEVAGAQAAIEAALLNGATELTIFYDYQGIESWAIGDWKTNKVLSIEYKAYIDSVKDKIDLHFCHVKGHSGIDGNERADKMAKQAVGIE